MNEFPKDIKFEFPWRTYQKDVLVQLESHLDDDHLNIVAAPGSGKTILGLEVMLRINKPTLVLAPSIAIRNQWITRFKEHFLQTHKIPEWISNDIRNPGFLTVSTYQGLHAAFSNTSELGEELEEYEISAEENILGNTINDDVLEKLKTKKIQTIVVDEAHHLRNAWWDSLIYLKDNIENPHIVSLTATPPYDVSPQEWRNYQNLCGPIDAEISVPELIVEDNLCPHQDYIFLNSLAEIETKHVESFRKNVKDFIFNLKRNSEFIKALKVHAFVQQSYDSIENILEEPEYFSSMLIFLNEIGENIPSELFKILGTSKYKIPKFSLEWSEILLQNFIFNDSLTQANNKHLIISLKKELRSIGSIENKKVLLQNNNQIKKLLKGSINKLNSILDIVKLESQNLSSDLRMVILTDYIRKESFPKTGETQTTIHKIGVVPIFEKIRQQLPNIKKLGILTGSIVVVPLESKDLLIKIAKEIRIGSDHIQIIPLAHDKNFLKIKIKGEGNQKIVSLITKLFSYGEIEVLVGTKSLLGEGWDAPSINTLILATFVGSFMLSNQMRGRAIRIDKNNPDKISNIWHLASVKKNNDYPGDDFETLKRRFKAFVGVSFKDNSIENGFDRMNIGNPPFNERKIKNINKYTIHNAENRPYVQQRWGELLKNGDIQKIIPEIKTDKRSLPRTFVLYNTIYALFWRSIFLGSYFFLASIQSIGEVRFNNLNEILWFLGFIILISLIISVPGLVKSLWLFLKNGPVSSNIEQIGKVVFKTLCKQNIIKTDVNKIRIISEKNDTGSVFCGMDGGTSYEKSIFLDCMEEIFNPIDNPRYILIRESKLNFWLRKDYHTVPKIIGANKKGAIFFSLMWSKYIGPHKLVYTRYKDGRKILVKARQNSISASFQKKSERRDVWK